MELKSIKINLKGVISDLLFSVSSGDKAGEEEVKERFEHYFYDQSVGLREKTLKYLLKSEVVKSNNKIENYFKTFVK